MLPLLAAQLAVGALSAYQSYSSSKDAYKQNRRQQALDNKAVELQANTQRQVSLFNYQTALDGLKEDALETEITRMQTISAARAAAGAAGVNGTSYDQTLADITANANRQKGSIERQASFLGADLQHDLMNIEARRVFGKNYQEFKKPGLFDAASAGFGTFAQLGGLKLLGSGAKVGSGSNYISSVQASNM